jgi:hypothetical protein
MANFISYSTVEHYCRPHLTNTYFQNTLLIQVESDSLLALRGRGNKIKKYKQIKRREIKND